MALVVQKYGGSSLSSPKKIKDIAKKIVERYNKGNKLVIIVSALGNTTDDLLSKAKDITNNPTPRELDMLLSVGERVSISLMSMAINHIQKNLAVSFTGSQIGLITDCNHTNAGIVEIKSDRLKTALNQGKIPVIAGFQGVSTQKEITTLGRGGSDTTAIAVTAVLGADFCEIYSDVKGIYSADPNKVKNAHLLKEIDYNSMAELAFCGAKVLKKEAVEYAKRLNIKISAGETKSSYIGTIVTNEILNKNKISAINYYDKLFYLTIPNKSLSLELCQKFPEFRFSFQVKDESVFIYDNIYQEQVMAFWEKSKFESIPCFSFAIIGSGVSSEQSKLSQIYEILDSYKIIAINSSPVKYEIFTKFAIKDSVLDRIHAIVF